MTTKRMIEIMKAAIVAYAFELEQQDYDSEEELHQVLLNEFGISEKEYKYITGHNNE